MKALESLATSTKELYHNDPEYRQKILDARKKAYWENREKKIAAVKKWRAENPDKCKLHMDANRGAKRLWYSAKSRAKRLNLPFDISIADIHVPEFCPALGVKLEYTEGIRTGHSPSLDRIVPSKGYVKQNIVVISDRANRIKNDATPQELMAIAQFILTLATEPTKPQYMHVHAMTGQ